MENLKDKINKLQNISEYRFKIDIIKNILIEFKKEFRKDNFNKAVELDNKKHPVSIEYEILIKIIDKYIEKKEFNIIFTPKKIVDGYGNIAVRI